ncbi:MAG TPA: YaiO family outer membrane beta-barrel protein [Acidiferrobacteraceae bacterium]|nr:YaiO family outer membrane beta-barrel protein [Acidiferrobacteraceae bacterium]
MILRPAPVVVALAAALGGCVAQGPSARPSSVAPTGKPLQAPAVSRAAPVRAAPAVVEAGPGVAGSTTPALPVLAPATPASDPYGSRRNYASFAVGTYASNHGYQADQFQRLEAGVHAGRSTWIGRLYRVNRYNLTDKGVDGYWYRSFGRGYWGYLYAAYDPASTFLPRTAYGVSLDRQTGRIVWSFAFRRMLYTQAAVDMYMPGVTYYFTDTVSLAARWYDVPVSGGQSVALTPQYEDGRHNRYYATVAFGEMAERPTAYSDFQKHSSYSLGVGIERRLEPRFSVGADALYQHRNGLYDRHGIDVFAKTWW